MSIELLPLETIILRIAMLRGQKILLDADLAALYGVPTKRFNEQVKRNLTRFPADFMFQVTEEESDALRSQFATLKTGRGQHRKYLPYAFTEHGAIMASMILNSARATEVSVYIVRAFVQLRGVLASHRNLANLLEKLENKTELMSLKQDTFERSTRVQMKQLFDAIRELMAPPAAAPKRPIGFVISDDAPAKPKAAKAKK